MDTRFTEAALPDGLTWLNEPCAWRCGDGLHITTAPDTDFWQRTHYGFQRDNGHGLIAPAAGDFTLTARVMFEPQAQYDQCGVMIRVDAETWIKVSTEYENPTLSRLGSVVTNRGYSDWATQDVGPEWTDVHYRVTREGDDFLIAFAHDGTTWQQMRVTHLHIDGRPVYAGVYACSPTGAGFTCCFHALTIEPG